METIINHYKEYDEQARFDKRHNQVEFLTTMHYIEKFLQPLSANPRILEIGAATGRYSRAIADMGYQVDSLELAQSNIDVFNSLLTPAQNIRITQGNALDLSMYANETFDLTLVFGPLYHLFTDEDKRKCISEALRVTKPGGVVFAAYVISDITLYSDIFQRNVLYMPDYIAKGKINPVTFATTSTPEDIFEMVRKEDIDRIMQPFPTTRLHYVATTLIARVMRDALDNMDDEIFDLYMRHHFAVCERLDMTGMTSHSLDIFRKNP
jgi:SAM-dependent methyltransferase